MKNVLTVLTTCLVILILGGGCSKKSTDDPIVNPPAKLQIDVKVDTNSISYGGRVTFTWTSQNAVSCTVNLNGIKESLTVNGSKSYTLNKNTFFEWIFTSATQYTETKSFMIFVTPMKAPTIHVSANPNQLPNSGGVSVITLTTTDADSVTSSLVGVHGNSGSFSTPLLLETTTYNFKAWGKGGTATDSITISVTTKTDLLTRDSWYIDSTWIKVLESDPWQLYSTGDFGEWKVYFRNGISNTYELPNTLISDGIWAWSSDEKYILHGSNDFQKQEVKQLDSTLMVLEEKVMCLGCPVDTIFQKTKSDHDLGVK